MSPYDQEQDRTFDQITSHLNEPDMPKKTEPMNAPTAIGIILILLAVIAIILWGFGLDRFLWIAATTGGVGAVLTAVGAISGRVKA